MAAMQKVTLGRAVCCIAATQLGLPPLLAFPQALLAALQEMTLGITISKAYCPCWHYSQALIAAIRQNSSLQHHCQETQGPLLFTSTGWRKCTRGLPPLLALPTSTDGGTAGSDIGQNSSLLHRRQNNKACRHRWRPPKH